MKPVGMFEVNTLAGLIDQNIGDRFCIFIAVKTDEIIRFRCTGIRRAVEGRMSADREIQRLRVGRILHAPFDCHGAALQAVGDGQFKCEGVFGPALFIVTQAESDRIRCLPDQCEFHIACKSMLSHGITLSLVAVEAFIYLSDKRKQYRRVPVPVSRIRLPDDLMLLFLVENAAELCPVRRDRNLQEFIFDDMHFISHGSLLIICNS